VGCRGETPAVIAENILTDLKSQFEAAVAASRTLTAMPSNATLLELYALYKQATVGDVTGDRPEGFDLVAAAKYDAWESHRGTPRDAAMTAYIALVTRLKG